MLFNIEPLRMSVHKVLPVVYDDSLSYYEVLAKTVRKLNEVINLTDEQTKFIQEFSDNLTEAINEWEEGLSTEWANYKKRIDAEWENYKSNTDEDIEIWKKLKEVEIERAVAEGIYAFAEYFEGIKNQAVDAADRAGDEADRAEAAADEAAENAVEAVMPTLQGIFDDRYAFKSAIGSPLVASTAAEMTDTNKIYVYVGDETGYTSGNWYYYDGTAWVSGGVYNSVAVVTDTTLTQSGVPADAKATGDEITDLKSALTDVTGVVLNKSRLRLGNITASTSGWIYQPTRTYGVITEQGYEIPIKKGTRFFLSDYSLYKLGVNWRDTNNNYGTSGWITSGIYVAITDGFYVLNIQLNDTSGTANVDDAYDILNIRGGRLNEIEKQIENLTPLPPIDSSKIERLKIINTINNGWGQGVARIGDKILMFNASNDTHTNHATVDIYNIADLTTRLYYIEHNLGHCASADYNEETDTLLIANGTYTSGIDSVIYLIPNISTLLENRTNLEYGSSVVKEINISTLAGEGVVACFGETADTIYAVKINDGVNYDTDSRKYFYKLYVGKGTTNMVANFPSSSVGTYTEQNSDIPNGTARVLMSEELEFNGELQGLKFNGKLLIPIDSRKYIHAVKMPYLVYASVTTDVIIDKIKYLFIANDLGNVQESEFEDIVLTDSNIAYISNGTKIFRIIL